MDSREERIGKNEALFREVNERINDLTGEFGGLNDADFICECGAQECAERLRLQLDDYEAVRQSATYFVVKPGHEIPDVETVLEEHEGYFVVAKHTDAAEVAVETDPRS